MGATADVIDRRSRGHLTNIRMGATPQGRAARAALVSRQHPHGRNDVVVSAAQTTFISPKSAWAQHCISQALRLKSAGKSRRGDQASA